MAALMLVLLILGLAVAWRRGRAYQRTQYPAFSVGLYLAIADIAVQNIFVGFLNADLADMCGAAVVGDVNALQVAFVYTADITQGMCSQWSVRVVA